MLKEQRITSIRQKLSNIAKKNNISYEYIVIEFLIERLIQRLILDKDLSKNLVFKGGYVSLRVYNSSRYTIDVDAVLYKGNKDILIDKILELAQKNLGDAVFFIHEATINIMDKSEYGGIRIIFRSGIGDIPKQINKAQVLHFDLGIGGPITPEPVKHKISKLLGDGELSWLVYPVESIVSEKLHSLSTRLSNCSRSKDIYDLSILLPLCKKDLLKKAVVATFKFREDPVPKDFVLLLKTIDTILLKAGWKTATSSLKTKLDFDTAYERVILQCARLL